MNIIPRDLIKHLEWQPVSGSLSPDKIAEIYTTSQSLSGIAPTYPVAPPSAQTHFREHAAPVVAEPGKQPVDPVVFDILLTNETNRRLKQQFGGLFILITTAFTLISYGIIVCTAIFKWELPAAAVTALIIQAPLQMIGILYVMARHLFPTPNEQKKDKA